MKTNVTKWGNSLGVRLPKAFADQIGIVEGEVELSLEGDSIVLKKPKYDLDELLSKINPENLHESVDFGKPVGNEIW